MGWPHHVTIVHPRRVDGDLDEEAKDWANARRTPACEAEVQQTSSVEVIDGREAQVTITSLYLPGPREIAAIDRVEWLGDTYEVSGVPAVLRNGAGRIDHTKVVLRKVDG